MNTVECTDHVTSYELDEAEQMQILTPGERVLCDVLEIATDLDDESSRLYGSYYADKVGIQPTPVWQLPDEVNGHSIYIKDETCHEMRLDGVSFDVAAFKRRGAWLAANIADEENPGLVSFTTASAGNHALGVALAAKVLGKQAHIYCKSDISEPKRQKLLALGATIHDNYLTIEDALVAAEFASLEKTNGIITSKFIHPFDQSEVIAGQAGMAFEWLRSMEAAQADGEVDLMQDTIQVVVPVGGGGLISAWAAALEYAKAKGRIGEQVRLVGAQMEGCDAMNRAMKEPANDQESEDLFGGELNDKCDGTAVLTPGQLTLAVVAEYVDEIITVSPGELGEAMYELGNVLKRSVEPAGSLAWAAANKLTERSYHLDDTRRSSIHVVASGANVSSKTQQYFAQEAFKAMSARALAPASQNSARPAEKTEKGPQDNTASRAIGTACLSGGTTRSYVPSPYSGR